MTAVATESSVPVVHTATEVPRKWKTSIALGVLSVVAFIFFGILGDERLATIVFSDASDAIALPNLPVTSKVVCLVLSIVLLALAAVSIWFTLGRRAVPIWVVIVFGALFVIALVLWTGAGSKIPVVFLITGSIALATPVVFGALAGVIGERVGVVNIAIEGQLLAGAFSSALVASVTGNPFLGLAAAAVAGMLVSFVLAAFAIKYLVDQVIVGVVLNVLVTGLTSFLFTQVLSSNSAVLNNPPRFDRLAIPVLSQIPIIGPTLFNQTIIVYAMYVAVALIFFGMFKTKWGLRLRAVGEYPTAADTVGIKVNPTRFWNVSLAGAVAGFGGAFFTLGLVGAFNKEMTAGAGFIALAAVIFGGWDPIRATLAALLFGFATNLQNVLGIIGSPVPSEFMLMLPYLVTIFAVAGVVGRVRGPAAAGKPYIKS